MSECKVYATTISGEYSNRLKTIIRPVIFKGLILSATTILTWYLIQNWAQNEIDLNLKVIAIYLFFLFYLFGIWALFFAEPRKENHDEANPTKKSQIGQFIIFIVLYILMIICGFYAYRNGAILL